MVSVLFITFVICLFVGVPVAFSLGVASLAYFLGAGMPIATFSQRFFAGIDSFTLLCISGFTLAGNLMNQGGISDKLMDFCDKLVGHLTGGMAYANIMASMIFAGISGTALSDTVALGGIEIPMMVDMGYDADFSVAVTAASSCMGPIIPPSLPMIMAATMTGLSVSKMFVAGMVPGILMGGGMALVSYVISKKKNYPKRDRMSTLGEIFNSGKEAIWAIIMTLIILGGIIFGWVTPTEASIICIVYGTFVGFVIYRKLTLRSFYQCLQQTLSSAASIMAPGGICQCIRLYSHQRAYSQHDRGYDAEPDYQQVHSAAADQPVPDLCGHVHGDHSGHPDSVPGAAAACHLRRRGPGSVWCPGSYEPGAGSVYPAGGRVSVCRYQHCGKQAV